MAIVLRFVNKDGVIKEPFFDIVYVSDTTSATLKEEICRVLSRHELSVQNIHGQGYDGASNMRGRWNGLQALFLNECPSAYYIHCFAHQFQLALVAASKEVISVNQFFSYLTLIVNIIKCSPKKHNQFRAVQAVEITEKLAIDEADEFETVLREIINDDDASSTQRAEEDGTYDAITSFEFVFILHLIREIMEITDDLCQALQRKSQDILNAMHLVATTKAQNQNFRESGWVLIVEKVTLFCEKHEIGVPDRSALYAADQGRSRNQRDITNEHHFPVDIFTYTVESQLQELSNRFKENVMELLVLSSALDPRDGCKSFKTEDICKLANKYYPIDFTEQEKQHLEFQLQNYKLDVSKHIEFQNLSPVSELCLVLVKTGKSVIYPLIDKLIRLVLTLPVSIATTELAFSAMKIVKTRLRNRMEDDFLASYLITYIERDIAQDFSVNSIVDAFNDMKVHRAQFKMPHFSR